MIDLRFAKPEDTKKFSCKGCPKETKKLRKCETDDFNLKAKIRVDRPGAYYGFCPGKATWYPEMVALVEECRVALETGILPKEGSFEEQSEMFCEAFPHFVDRWKERTYLRIWSDVHNFTESTLKSLFGKGKGSKKTK